MPISILMPALSPTMTEGNLAKWIKNEGDKVAPGDVIAEIETDKATMEVEAVDAGFLARIVVQAGTEGVAVNQLIAVILEEDEDQGGLDAFLAEHAQGASVAAVKTDTVEVSLKAAVSVAVEIAPVTVTPTVQVGRVSASPLAKRIATQNGVGLQNIQGSGPHGRIIKRDIEMAMKAGPSAPAFGAGRAPVEVVFDAEGLPPYAVQPYSLMRKAISRRLTESKQLVPHFYVTVECAIDGINDMRNQINGSFEGVKVSVNDCIIRACAMALQAFPAVNVGWSEQGMRQFSSSDIAVAVAIDGGLTTPILRAAQSKSLFELSSEVKGLVERAKAGKLQPQEFMGGTFSLSNLGMLGVRHFQAIINPPQAAILAVGAGERRPVVKNDKIEIATMMSMTLSVDHRVIDGAVAAEFLQVLKTILENPMRLLI